MSYLRASPPSALMGSFWVRGSSLHSSKLGLAPALVMRLSFASGGRAQMKGYGQLCPVAKAAEVFCERWTALILRDLGGGATRFTELKHGVPLMSRSMLSRRLQELEHEGIIERRPNETGRGCTYHLTLAGRAF